MKLKFIKEIDVTNVDINISIDLKKDKSTIVLSYTCSDCGGYGCRRDNGCLNGIISMRLEPNEIDKHLDEETASKLRSVIQKLSSSMTEHQYSEPAIIPFL